MAAPHPLASATALGARPSPSQETCDHHVFVVVRYSVLTTARNGYSLADRMSYSRYRQRLFDPARLAKHHALFTKLTLPSLVHQSIPPTPEWFTLLVLTSSELPPGALADLQTALSPYPWSHIEALPPDAAEAADATRALTRRALQAKRRTTGYVMTRLDDDDAVSTDFFARMLRYVDDGLAGFAVSAPTGYAATVDRKSGGIRCFHLMNLPKAAQGLSYLNRYDPGVDAFHAEPVSVFELGHHLRVDAQAPTVLDAREPAYIRTLHDASTQSILFGRKHLKKYQQGDPVPRDVVAQRFVIDAMI